MNSEQTPALEIEIADPSYGKHAKSNFVPSRKQTLDKQMLVNPAESIL